MEKQVINGQQVVLAEQIKDFIVKQQPSSNVDFFGYGPTGDVFVQFKNGLGYIYKDVSNDTIIEMCNAPSIGKFVSQTIVKTHAGIKQSGKLVTPVKQESEQA